jgi:hypothetical protein
MMRLNKRFVAVFIFCLLTVGILSNRFFWLRQLTGEAIGTASLHAPGDAEPIGAAKRFLPLTISNEGDSDLEQFSSAEFGIKENPPDPPRSPQDLIRLQTEFGARAPLYILQSVLNL